VTVGDGVRSDDRDRLELKLGDIRLAGNEAGGAWSFVADGRPPGLGKLRPSVTPVLSLASQDPKRPRPARENKTVRSLTARPGDPSRGISFGNRAGDGTKTSGLFQEHHGRDS